MKKIFVSIACYRDREIEWTLNDLYRNAAYPERIYTGICWQFISPADDSHFNFIHPSKNIRCIGYDARQSMGACWAKSEADKLKQDEDYLLRIDSHTRVAKNWDVMLIKLLDACPSQKPILSTYPPLTGHLINCKTKHRIWLRGNLEKTINCCFLIRNRLM